MTVYNQTKKKIKKYHGFKKRFESHSNNDHRANRIYTSIYIWTLLSLSLNISSYKPSDEGYKKAKK